MLYTINISRDDNDRRLDRFLRSRFKWVSLGDIMKSIRTGSIIINSKHSKKPDLHIYEGDEILVPWSDKKIQSRKKFTDLGRIKIIYQSEDLLILNKPAGLLVQPDVKNGDSVITRVKDVFNNAYAVHRLDRNTTGVLVVALHGDTLRKLENIFKLRTVQKYYIAVVSGSFPDELTIDAPLKKNAQKVEVDYKNGLNALSICKKLVSNSKYSLVMINLKTGRTHQARVHLAYSGYPIVGDTKYGFSKISKRPLLHAYKLIFPSDFLDSSSFTAPLPDDIKNFIDLQKWHVSL